MNGQPSYRVGVIADTHGFLHPGVFEVFAGVDLILHAGDVGEGALLEELATLAPVKAVSGNVDGPSETDRPPSRQLTTRVGRIAVTHGHLAAASAFKPETMVAYFRPFNPQIIVYGHTHLPTLTELKDVKLFNPGAAGKIRVDGRPPSVGLITLDDGRVAPRLEHVSLE
jgi:putative phosphoesterase